MNRTITLLIIGVIFLALLLLVLNSFMAQERSGASAPVAAEKARPQEHASSAQLPEERFAPAAREGQGAAASLPLKGALQPDGRAGAEAPSVEGVTVKTVPAQIDAGQAPPVAAGPPAPSAPQVPAASFSPPADMPEPGAKHTTGGGKNITSIVVYATQEGATLRIVGDRPLAYKSMLLRKPGRLVIDLEGHWNVTVPGIPQNRLIKAIRVGRQAGATRMVVDLHREPASYRLIKPSPTRLDARLR